MYATPDLVFIRLAIFRSADDDMFGKDTDIIWMLTLLLQDFTWTAVR